MSNQNKILLVEDEKDLAELFSLRLKADGFDITVATNGLEAIKLIKKINPDLVLLDLVMPDMDGYEVLKKLKKDKVLNETIIYVWSNLTQKDEIDKAKKLGANGYLVKSDYTPSKLSEKVKEILNNK